MKFSMLIPLTFAFFGFNAEKTVSPIKTISNELMAFQSINVVEADTNKVDRIDRPPRPVGGMEEFYRFIGQNYDYPKEAELAKVKGRVIMSFVVERDGTIGEIKILKDLGYGTGEAAVKMLEKSPKWIPGIQKGEPVRVRFTLPLEVDPGVQKNNTSDSTVTKQ